MTLHYPSSRSLIKSSILHFLHFQVFARLLCNFSSESVFVRANIHFHHAVLQIDAYILLYIYCSVYTFCYTVVRKSVSQVQYSMCNCVYCIVKEYGGRTLYNVHCTVCTVLYVYIAYLHCKSICIG